MSALEGQVTNLEEFVGGIKVTSKVVERRTIVLELRQDQLKRHVAEALNANVDTIQGVLNTIVGPEMKNKVELQLGLGRTFKGNSRGSFIQSMSRMKLKLSCTGFCNKT
ncbi:hypothetical protein J1N35_033432 [Gossypium stocksii]|uniref:Uncharacterized protein n=1 Tax=Gossypium stocksii TaxID=47602 RepID=A0A9D3UQ56_9ROSI|nr:hypothetical protein J1N35_033432 [Gossypium stocksii]